MKAHIILAHPEAKSFNSSLARLTEQLLSVSYEVTFSDLYATRFDPYDRPEHYADQCDPAGFHVQSEQRRHSEAGTTPADIAAEADKLISADLLIVHFPLWWFGMPAILKGWIDRVFVYGSVYKSTMRHDRGICRGKKMIACVTTGSSGDACSNDGIEGDTYLHLWPLLYPFRYIGFDVLEPFVLHGIGSTSYLEGTDQGLEELKPLLDQWGEALRAISDRTVTPYNRDDDFDAKKKLKTGETSYSPFISSIKHGPWPVAKSGITFA